MNILEQAIFYFALYSVGGWIVQGIYVGFKKRHFVNTGFLYGPYVPIYGFGALIIIYIIDPFFHNILTIFLATFLLCSILEYFTSWALEKLFHRTWWNYSKLPFNIHGRVCLLNSSLYGAGGIVVTEWVQPLMKKLLAMLSATQLQLFDIFFLVIFLTDLTCTLIHMVHKRQLLHAVHAHVQAIKEQPARLHELHAKLHADMTALANDRHLKVFPDAKLTDKFAKSIQTAKEHLNS